MADTDTDSGAVQEAAETEVEKSRWRKIWGWVLIAFYVLGIISAIDSIMSTRTEPGAIAWSIALVTAPVVAVPAYWVLGRSRFEGYVEALEDAQEDFDDLVAQTRRAMDSLVVDFHARTPGFDALCGLARMRLTRGNGAELLINPPPSSGGEVINHWQRSGPRSGSNSTGTGWRNSWRKTCST